MTVCTLCENPERPLVKGRRKCRPCLNDKQRAYYATPKGKAAFKNAQSKWYRNVKSTPAYRGTGEAWRRDNTDKIRVGRLKRYAANRDKCQRTVRDKLRELRASKPVHFRKYLDQRKGNHRALILQAKSHPCVDCGEMPPPVAMDFDHVRGKSRNVADLSPNSSPKTVLREIAKCDLVCARCHRVRTAHRRGCAKSKRRCWLDSLKTGPCKDCNRSFPPEAMDFDHVRGLKFAGIAQMWGCSKTKLLAELRKCELVCACCHRVRTERRAA